MAVSLGNKKNISEVIMFLYFQMIFSTQKTVRTMERVYLISFSVTVMRHIIHGTKLSTLRNEFFYFPYKCLSSGVGPLLPNP
jgi:hypothetical protein